MPDDAILLPLAQRAIVCLCQPPQFSGAEVTGSELLVLSPLQPEPKLVVHKFVLGTMRPLLPELLWQQMPQGAEMQRMLGWGGDVSVRLLEREAAALAWRRCAWLLWDKEGQREAAALAWRRAGHDGTRRK